MFLKFPTKILKGIPIYPKGSILTKSNPNQSHSVLFNVLCVLSSGDFFALLSHGSCILFQVFSNFSTYFEKPLLSKPNPTQF
jgi:hypothetical protein